MPSTPYAWLAPSPTSETDRLVRMPPIALRRRMSRLTRTTVKFVDAAPEDLLVVGLDTQGADVERTELAGDAAATEDRHHRAALQADAPAVEQGGCVATAKEPAATAEPPADAPAREVEDAVSLQEKLPLLGKEEAEAGQVHLLLVHLHLREVGVVGEVGREVRCDADLHVEAEIAVAFRRPSVGWR